LDKTADQTIIRDKAILVVSFGTTDPETRRLNIGAVEDAISEAAGDDYIVRRCFTSQMIIIIINKRENIRIDNISEALERAAGDGIRTLIVQPTHLMNGLEYDKLSRILGEHADSFDSIALGDPLLTSEEDFSRAADALIEASSEYDDGDTALVFMGHGTEAASNGIYERMQKVFAAKGRDNYYVGTVEARPSIDDVISAVGLGDYSRVVLRPLMLVAGNHAVNDMADPEDPYSWYSRFTEAGYETKCIIEGLGQIAAVRDMYADHALRAADKLNRDLSQ
jgi:sirohydrochlorin cobaltochelatase